MLVHVLIFRIHNLEENVLISSLHVQPVLVIQSPNCFHSNHAEERAVISFFASKNLKWLVKACKCGFHAQII